MQHSKEPQHLECHDCALPVLIPILHHKQKALCPRCGLQLTSFHQSAIEYIVAFAITALLFLLATIPFPFLSFSAKGQYQQMDMIQGLLTLIDHQFLVLAILQISVIFIIPLIILCGLIYLLLPVILVNKPPPAKEKILNLIFMLIPWSMAEIFLIGALVSLIKIISVADITLGLSFYAYIIFSICMVSTITHLDKVQLQNVLEIAHPPVAHRKFQNKQFTWALLITSVILYIPASTLPIMTTRLLGHDDPGTIMEGVILLWEHGSHPIAIIIFIASVFIPLAKMILLAWLNYSIQLKSNELNQQRMLLYRITEFVGRWSMIDVFVVIILVSLIQLGNTMSIYPGPAALAFSGVVIVTMLAAMSFDSHLIWHTDTNDDTSARRQ